MNASYAPGTMLPEVVIEDKGTTTYVKPNPLGSDRGYKPSKVETTEVIFEAINGGFKSSVQIHVTDKSLGIWDVALESSQRVVTVGEHFVLPYEVQTDPTKPDAGKSVIWASSDESVATVDSKTGEVRALADGETTIRMKTDTGGFVTTCTLSVRKGIMKMIGVSLDQGRPELLIGRFVQLIATILPENIKTKTVNWLSDSRLAVEADEGGSVSTYKGGTATIIVTALGGGYTATCKVTVSAELEELGTNVMGVNLDASSLSLNKGKETVLATVVSPSNTISKSVTWNPSDAVVATVASDGMVKAGIASIATTTAVADEGGYAATYEVTIMDPNLGNPVVEVKDSMAILTLPKVPEATFYEVFIYKYVNRIPILFGVHTVDTEGNILTGLMSELRSGKQERVKVSVPELDKSSKYVVKATTTGEGNGR